MTDEPRRVGELDIEQDLRIQRKVWVVQRLGWALMALVDLAALLGLTGRGWLSTVTTGATGALLRVEYERFGRYGAETPLHVHLDPEAGADTTRV